MLRWVTLYSFCKTTGHVVSTPPLAPYLQRTWSLSIAGSFLPLWQQSKGPRFLLSFTSHLLTQSIQNKMKEKNRNTSLTALCTC